MSVLLLRYLAAIVLGLAMLLGLFVSLTFQGLNRTVLNPEFIPEQLEEADFYRFVMNDMLVSTIDDTRKLKPQDYGLTLRENPIATSGLSTSQLVDSFHRAMSPQELRQMVSPVALGIGEYIAGDRDQVDLSMDAAGHIMKAAVEIQALMREGDAYDLFLEREFEPRVREITGRALATIESPHGWPVFLFRGSAETEDRMADAVMLAFTADWLAEQVEQGLDESPAYLVGDSDTFEFNIPPNDEEVEKSQEEIKALLLETDSLELLYVGVVERPVRDGLREPVALPYGIEISPEDVLLSMQQVASPSWVREQAETVVDGVSTFVVGKSDEFSVDVSLIRNRSEATSALTEIAIAKVTSALVDLPPCEAEADVALEQFSSGRTLPDCVASGISASELSDLARPAIEEAVRSVLLTRVPDTVTLNEETLRSTLREAGGREFLESFDRLRDFFSDGWTYNQDSLRADLSQEPEILRLLDGTRSYLSEGYIHTYEEERAEGGANQAGEALDNVRKWVHSARRYEWPAYLATSILLVGIGLILGRSWPGKIGWASSALLAAAAAAYAFAGPLFRGASGEAFDQVRSEALSQAEGHFGETAYLAASKLVDMAEAATNEFAAAISQAGLMLAVAALATLLAVTVWRRYQRSTLQ